MRYVFHRMQNRDIDGGYMGGKRAFCHLRQKCIVMLEFSRKCAEIDGAILNLMHVNSV